MLLSVSFILTWIMDPYLYVILYYKGPKRSLICPRLVLRYLRVQFQRFSFIYEERWNTHLTGTSPASPHFDQVVTEPGFFLPVLLFNRRLTVQPGWNFCFAHALPARAILSEYPNALPSPSFFSLRRVPSRDCRQRNSSERSIGDTNGCRQA